MMAPLEKRETVATKEFQDLQVFLAQLDFQGLQERRVILETKENLETPSLGHQDLQVFLDLWAHLGFLVKRAK